MSDDFSTATLAILDQLCVLMRLIEVHGVEHEGVGEAAIALRQAVSAAKPPLTIQCFPDVVLRERVALSLDADRFRRWQRVLGPLARLGIQELAFDQVPDAKGLLALGQALSNTSRKGEMFVPAIAGLRLQAVVRSTAAGGDVDAAALDVFLTNQLQQLCHAAVPLCEVSEAHWNWSAGRAIAWRIERCVGASVSASTRVFETAQLPWSRARRSITAAYIATAVLARLRASPLTQRAVTHAMLALGCSGYGERSGLMLSQAAQVALARLLAPESPSDTEPDPHRLRTCALLNAAMHLDKFTLPLLPLLHACYEVERQRFPADVAVEMSTVDLQAWLACALGREIHPGWGRALLATRGVVAPGSYVLADGRLGIVAGPSESRDAWRPRVLTGGGLMVPQQPVSLHSPLGMTPWAK